MDIKEIKSPVVKPGVSNPISMSTDARPKKKNNGNKPYLNFRKKLRKDMFR